MIVRQEESPPDVIFSIPGDLSVPLDDGACRHLKNMKMPNVSLWSTDDQQINLSLLPGRNVILCYPMTGRPGVAIPDGWLQIPGAAWCTPQVCSYRDRQSQFKDYGVGVYGISTQTSEAQKEASYRLGLSYPLLSDANHSFSSALKLPLFEADGLKLMKRVTLIFNNSVIEKCFYPVFPPDKNVMEVMAWFSENQALRP
jgi:peroxiredoxin